MTLLLLVIVAVCAYLVGLMHAQAIRDMNAPHYFPAPSNESETHP